MCHDRALCRARKQGVLLLTPRGVEEEGNGEPHSVAATGAECGASLSGSPCLRLWASHLTSLGISFLLCNMEIKVSRIDLSGLNE